MPVRLIASLAALAAALFPTSANAESEHQSETCFGAAHSVAYETGRIGIGGAVGHEWQIDQRDGDQLSLLGQFRLTPRTTLEAEYGRTEYDDGNDVDRRLGGALAFQVGRLAFLSPFIVAGGGAIGEGRDPYLEAGGGIKFPVTRNIVLMLDVRSGKRWGQDEASGNGVGPQPMANVVQPENRGSVGDVKYSRWRLVGMIFF